MKIALSAHKDVMLLSFLGATDRLFEIRPDRTVHEIDWDDDNREITREVNFYQELREIAEQAEDDE